MPDTTAELLFTINANADDATENIARFRSLMSTDLSTMASQFQNWSDEVLGEITTVQAAMTAGFAVMAAGILAAGVAVGEASKEYEKYANEVSSAMKLTGAGAEDMSMLHEAAAQSGVSFEALTNGLVKFEQSIVKASGANNQQAKAFAVLGISQADVIAGQKNMLPLLEKVMDGFNGNASAVQRAALAKDLFTRSGPELLNFLNKGSEWLRKMREEADELHLTLTTKNIADAREFTQTQRVLAAEIEGANTVIGKQTQGLRVWWATFEATTVKFLTNKEYFGEYTKAWKSTVDEIAHAVQNLKTNMVTGDNPIINEKQVAELKAARDNFTGISSIVESMKGKIAGQGSEWDKLAEEVAHYQFEIQKSRDELVKMQTAGTVTTEARLRETAALAQAESMLAEVIRASGNRMLRARMDAIIQAHEAEEGAQTQAHTELVDRLASYESESYDHQRAALQKEVDSLRESLEKKAALTEEEYDLLEQIQKAGLDKIQRAQNSAFLKQVAELQQTLDAQFATTQTGRQRLEVEYSRDLEKYAEQEREKTATLLQGSVERNTIESLYGTLRSQLLLKYQNDLNTLKNSQGWQGVFGSTFSQMIRGNEALFREWSTSANQSLMGVRVTMESLKELSEQAFQSFAQGMGQNIAQALEYKKSMGEAMQAALASTLESFAGQAIAAALMATGWGLYDLGMGDYAAAGQMFDAAAIFGGFGAMTALAGRAIAPPQNASTASAGTAGSSGPARRAARRRPADRAHRGSQR